MKNVYLLESKQPCRLHSYSYSFDLALSKEPLQWKQGKNIYITINQEIQEGVDQWYLDKVLNEPYNSGGAQYASKQDIIVLTTDIELIKDGVQEIPDEFLEWFVKNSNCEEVKTERSYSMSQSSYSGIEYEIIIPKKEPFKHECRVLTTEEVMEGRSNAYDFIDFDKETFDQYLQRLKDRRTEDNYKYTDEDFKNYIHHIFDCYEKNMSVYKCLEFMHFIEREVKLEDIFNDEKKEDVKKVISEHKEKLQKEQDEFAIKFANWLRKEDTPENAEKWFHYSDMDMLNAFKEENK